MEFNLVFKNTHYVRDLPMHWWGGRCEIVDDTWTNWVGDGHTVMVFVDWAVETGLVWHLGSSK